MPEEFKQLHDQEQREQRPTYPKHAPRDCKNGGDPFQCFLAVRPHRNRRHRRTEKDLMPENVAPKLAESHLVEGEMRYSPSSSMNKQSGGSASPGPKRGSKRNKVAQ